MDVSLSRLMHWDTAPENAGRLHAAGVRIAMTTDGLSSVGSFLKQVRTAVKRGLDKDGALAALTVNPAKMFGVDDRVGTLDVGRAAHVVVMDGDLVRGQVEGRRDVGGRPAV